MTLYKTCKNDDIFKIFDEKSNVYRVKAIKDFIRGLNEDYVKYNNKKNKYCLLRNILMGVDISLGGLLAITGVILETFGGSSILSGVMGATRIWYRFNTSYIK